MRGLMVAAAVLATVGPAAAVQPVTLVALGSERQVDEAALRALPQTGMDVVFITRTGRSGATTSARCCGAWSTDRASRATAG